MSATATTTPAAKGLGTLRCLRCGADACVHLRLDDLTSPECLHCPECTEDFGPDDVRAAVAGWQRFLAWYDRAVALAPDLDG